MFIVVSLVDKWIRVCAVTKQGNREGSAMLLSLFISCVLTPPRC